MTEQVAASKKEILLRYVSLAIYGDYLLVLLITSASEGREASIGLDYGLGKSSLMLHIADLFLSMSTRFDGKGKRDIWDFIFNTQLITFPWELERLFYTLPVRYPGDPVFVLIDDMQRSFGKDRSKDNYIRSLANRLTTSRQQIAVVIGSAPDISEIAYPFRYKFNFEVKCPQRGKFEIQRLKKWTDFQNPYVTRVSMPKADFSTDAFPQLEKEFDERYKKWRHEANIRHDEGEGEWRLRDIRNVLTDEAKELLNMLVEKGSYQRQHIITVLDKALELKLLIDCGMVVKFGDTIVPSKQARKMVKLV